MVKWFLLPALIAGALAQQSDSTLRPFVGTWRGLCADGQAFVLVTLSPADGTLTGTVRLANMRGGDDGQCVAVVDPPSDKHALPVTGAKLSGSTLTFQGARRMEFEMSLATGDNARLKLIGTASEENPWKLVRAK